MKMRRKRPEKKNRTNKRIKERKKKEKNIYQLLAIYPGK